MAVINVTLRKPLWVDELLKENDMSCDALCEQCNLPKGITSRIVGRQWSPTKGQMQCVAKVFGRKTQEVIFGHDCHQDEERGCS
jgi:hypothetical protein